MGAITHDRGRRESGRVAIWGGVECTVNRVGDNYFDQLERNGHAYRLDDLRAFADLGIRTLRFPLLWERTAPEGLSSASWAWADERMELMRELGIRPIVGLVHHGSGPRSTSLLDPGFGEKLAEYARAVAERYPWADSYTPVNEPLTTARFSALYGVWYPHARHDRSFVQALLNECRGTSLAMRAIREVNPDAQLVQTEDLGMTHSTPMMRYQARFENHRRWLTFDLLRGDVDEAHPLWKYLRYQLSSGIDLLWMRDNPAPPDIIGLNYYVTSERYLDERIENFPGCAVGGNRRHRYVDVEAVRVLRGGLAGPKRLIGEVWDRYQVPVAITEVHMGCARSEQMRWLRDVYDAAEALRSEGVDVRGVTAWALLGAYDWNCLVTRQSGFYEPGVFDVRGGSLRLTALAQMVRSLAAGERPRHPVLDQPGWWNRDERILYPAVPRGQCTNILDGSLDSWIEATRDCHNGNASHADPAAGADGLLHVNGTNGESHNGNGVERHRGILDLNGAVLTNGAAAAGPVDAHNGNGATHAIGVIANGPRANGAAHANGHAARGTISVGSNGHANGHDRGSTGDLMITGATGTLGRAVARMCRLRGIAYRLLSRQDMDIAERSSVDAALDRWRPWALVNAAGFVRVDDAEVESDTCLRESSDGPATLASSCAERGIALVTFSSDLVFDGTAARPYVESDLPRPLNVYGMSKARAESQVLAAMPDALVIRTSAFFSPHDGYNFVTRTLRALQNDETVDAADDMTVSPTYVPDLVDEVLNLLLDGESGIWHLVNEGAITWYELACRVAKRAGLDTQRIIARSSAELGLGAARPRYSALASERAQLLPSLDDAIERYLIELRTHTSRGVIASARRVYSEA